MMKLFQYILSIGLLLTSQVAATCPNFSLDIDIEGGTCNGDITAFNNAFSQLYAGLMRLEERQTKTGNGEIANEPLNELMASSKTEFEYQELNTEDGELVVQATDGAYTIKKNNEMQVRRLNEEVGGSEEHLMDFLDLTEQDRRYLTEPDCGTRSWCLQHSWCCIICPHYCPSRRALTQQEGRDLSGPPDVVHPCDFLETQDTSRFPGCLANAKITCTKM